MPVEYRPLVVICAVLLIVLGGMIFNGMVRPRGDD